MPAQPIRPPSNEKQLLSWLRDKRERGRKPMPEKQWKLNLCFVLSHQWLEWDGNARQFNRASTVITDRNAPVRLTINKITGLLERQIAKLTKNVPLPECRPVSDDDQDVSAARVSTRILSHECDRLDWDSWLVDFLFMPGSLGTSYAHIYWDPTKGDKLGQVEQEGQATDVFIGDVCLDDVPAFELAVEPGAKTLKAALWCVRTTTMSDEAIFERWGKEVTRDEKEAMVRTIADEVLALSDSDEHGNVADNFHAVHQFWMKPCRAAPKGLVVTWSGNTVLEKMDFPYAHGLLPFAQMDFLPGLGGRLGRTWVTDAVPIQFDYNDARSREATFRRTLVPKLLAPVGSIRPGSITSRVEVIQYNPTGAPPQWETPDSNWMNQYEQGMARADQEMGERAGQSEASQGNAPSTMPAAAILALQEADDTKLAITAKGLAQFIKDVGYQVLMLTKQYWTEERTVRVYSEENVLEAYRYQGADIADRLDVHVSAEQGLPRSKAARTQLMLELHARGVIQTPEVLIRALDLPGTDFIVREWDLDLKRQARETAKMLRGEDAEVREYDNHVAHMHGLDTFRKSIDYEQLPKETQARIDAHWMVHAGWLAPQMGSPNPNTPVDPEAAAMSEQAVEIGRTGGAPTNDPYLQPETGAPQDPLAAASGQGPSAVSDQGIYKDAGIGQAAGQPGRVPGTPADQQAASMGN